MRGTEDKNLYYLAAVYACSYYNSLLVQELLNIFSDGREIWEANETVLRKKGVPEKIIEKLVEGKEFISPDQIEKRVEGLKLKVISWDDDKYPKMLREIPDFPMVLYIRGELDPEDVFIGVVGSRNVSQYGLRMASKVVQGMMGSDVVVVSGLALGVDSVAHQVVVDNRKKTIAVMACGLNRVYPNSHNNLARKILENGGALISEYPPGVEPLKHHFLARNRIIAGLGPGTLVVEAGERSGALTTARCALEYGRSVYALPGDVERPQAQGTNNLIRQGATPIFKGEDILNDLNIVSNKEQTNKNTVDLSTDEEIIWLALNSEPKHIDILGRETGIGIAKLSSVLMGMELRDLIKDVGSMCYVKNL